MTEKRSRSERDYGLPRLTIAEATRVLGVTDAEFMAFIYSLRPSPGRFSRWVNDEEPLPEVLVRLYRHQKLGGTPVDTAAPEPQHRPPEHGERKRSARVRRERAG